jgi:tetratricopeptide (TPR) repeat protein
MARADALFRLDTEDSIRSAIQLEPDAWRYFMRLSQFDDADAKQLLEQSLQLNRYNAPADIELGLDAENAGNYGQAEKLMLAAFAIDRTFATRWALANFYFRRGNEAAFWEWAGKAARIPADNSGALFDLCWRESANPDTISKAILNDNPKLIRQYIEFLLAKDQLPAAAGVAERLLRDGDARSDTAQLLTIVNRLIAADDGASAQGLWHALADRRWIKEDATLVNNPQFARDPLPAGFDWSLPSYDGLNSWIGAAGLETEFTGRQPEACVVAEQFVVLAPGNYSLESSYHTSEIAAGSGLNWQVVDAASGKPLAESADLSSDALRAATLTFAVPQNASLLSIRLIYQRPLGTVRISGGLVVENVQIRLSQ